MKVLCIGLDHRIAIAGTRGHAATWSLEIAKRLEEYVVIVEDISGEASEKVALSQNVTVYPISGNRMTFPFRAAQLARKLHAIHNFDLCTVEDPFRPGYAGLLFKRATGTPLNVENHTLMIDNPEWIRARWINRIYNVLGIQVLKQADSIRNRSDDQLFSLLELGISRDRIFTVSQPVRIPSGVKHASLRRMLGIAENDIVFLAVARMIAIKNISCVLQAFKLLDDPRTRLVLAGDGPERVRWERETKNLGLQDRIHWMGAVPEDDILDFYAMSDIFVTASLHETGPRTVLEAFAAGKAVIGTPKMGVVDSEILQANKSGLVVEPSPIPFSVAMRTLAASSELRAQMGAEGRERALESRSYERIADQVFDSWQRTLVEPAEASSNQAA